MVVREVQRFSLNFFRPPSVLFPIGGSPMFAFLLWCVLFVMCWPLALFALVIYPFVWLLLLPFRILGIAVHGVLELVREIFLLPVRLMRAPFRV